MTTRSLTSAAFVSAFCSILLPSSAQEAASSVHVAEPVVARMEMKLALGEKVLDTIEKGDLLTVLEARENSFVIRTFNGHKGVVSDATVAGLAEATPIYDELIEAAPGEGRLYTMRASCHWALGDNEKALSDFDKAIELGYDTPHAYASRGLFHSAVGEHAKAVADFTLAIKGDPQDDVPLLNRAGVYMSMGKYEEAIADYAQAAKLRPDNPILFQQQAIAHKLLGRLERAVADYDKAIELSDNNVSAWMGRGFVKFQLGLHEEAIKDFSRAFELSPESAVAVNNRGYNYQLLGKEKLALDDFTRAIELAPSYLLALQNKAWLLTIAKEETLRDPVAAIQTATSANELSQYQDFSDLTLLAAAHASANEFETAIGWQEKSLEFAGEDQRHNALKLLELYQNKQHFDPRLLDANEDLSADGENPAAPPTIGEPSEPAEKK